MRGRRRLRFDLQALGRGDGARASCSFGCQDGGDGGDAGDVGRGVFSGLAQRFVGSSDAGFEDEAHLAIGAHDEAGHAAGGGKTLAGNRIGNAVESFTD